MSQFDQLKPKKLLPVLMGIAWACSGPAMAQGPAVNVIRLNETHEVAPVELPGATPAVNSDINQLVPALAAPPVAVPMATPTATPIATPLAAPGSALTEASSATKLSGGTSIVHVELANVRDILLDVRRAKESASHLYGEVTRHPITSYNYVDSMGPVMMEIPMPTFDMTQVLPARQQWVELYMKELNPIVAYVKADLDGIKIGERDLSLPEKDKSTFDQDLAACSDAINKAVVCGGQLKKLTVAPPYDNVAIASQCSELHKDLREVEKTTKRMIGQIKKSRP